MVAAEGLENLRILMLPVPWKVHTFKQISPKQSFTKSFFCNRIEQQIKTTGTRGGCRKKSDIRKVSTTPI